MSGGSDSWTISSETLRNSQPTLVRTMFVVGLSTGQLFQRNKAPQLSRAGTPFQTDGASGCGTDTPTGTPRTRTGALRNAVPLKVVPRLRAHLLVRFSTILVGRCRRNRTGS